MMLRPALRRAAFVSLMFPMLFAGKCKDKAEDTDAIGDIDDGPVAPTVKLQLISMEPNRIDADAPFRGILYGSEFQPGATVRVGDTQIASVNVRDSNTIALSGPPLSAGAYDVQVTNPGGDQATLRAGLISRVNLSTQNAVDCSMVRVWFDTDAASIRPDAQATLSEYASCFQAGTAQVRIEGHTDERGTTDYNLALGQRRAEAVRRYLQGQGVVPSRIRTLSFGEERPAERGGSEGIWSKNRRADISVSK